MSKWMSYLMNIWFSGYMNGFMDGREQELELYHKHIRNLCKASPSGFVVVRDNGGKLDLAELPKGVIKGWRDRK